MKIRKSIAHIIVFLILIVPVIALVAYHLINNQSYVVQAQATSFVTREGSKLMLNGQEFRFIGVNREGLASSLFFRFPSGVPVGTSQSELNGFLDNTFTKLKENNINAVRFWSYQSYVNNNGTIDFSAIDNVINRAKAKGIKLIPVLENQWHWSTQGGDKNSAWYQSGYLSSYGTYNLSYKEYVGTIVSRYKDEPTILMWQLVNEATSDPTALYNFTVDMSSHIKSIDPNHLVSLGTSGTGQPGTAGVDYKTIHSIPSVDVVEAHDYNYPEEPLPGSPQSPRSQAFFELYVTDNLGVWKTVVHRRITLGKWVTLYSKLPSPVTTPITKAALNIKVNSTDSWSGPIYVDDITLGLDTYDFESGTQGWGISGASVTSITKSLDRGYNGSTSSLKVDLNGTTAENGKVHLTPPPASLGANSDFIMHVYVPADAPSMTIDTMYSDLGVAKSPDVNKPFFFGEVGIKSGCSDPDCYSVQDRANLFDAKISSALTNGAAGYVAWEWDNSTGFGGTSCSYFGPYCFDENDPLATTLKKIGDEININPPTPTPEPSMSPSPSSEPTPSPEPSPTPSPNPSPSPEATPTPEITPTPSPVPEPPNSGNSDGSGSSSGSSGSSGGSSSGPSVLSARTGSGADLNGDGRVNIFDLSSLLSNWGRQASFAGGDINGDGIVSVVDLSILLSGWGG